MSKTKHLDTAIDIFRSDKAKRARRSAEIHVMDLGAHWAVQMPNGKILQLRDTREEAVGWAEEQCKKLQALTGKTHQVVVY